MTLRNKLLSLLPALLLAGCATTYREEGVFTNGYSDSRVKEDTYKVVFRASEFTPKEKVLEYAKRRAGELTLKKGYRYYTILSQKKPPGLHEPSIQLTIRCFHHIPEGIAVIDARAKLPS